VWEICSISNFVHFLFHNRNLTRKWILWLVCHFKSCSLLQSGDHESDDDWRMEFGRLKETSKERLTSDDWRATSYEQRSRIEGPDSEKLPERPGGLGYVLGKMSISPWLIFGVLKNPANLSRAKKTPIHTFYLIKPFNYIFGALMLVGFVKYPYYYSLSALHC